MEYRHEKSYENHSGLDLRSSDLTRPLAFATSIKNVQYRQSGAPEKRKGYKPFGGSIGGCGWLKYNRVDPETGLDTPEKLTIGDKLYRYFETSFVVTYSGSAASAQISVFLDSVTRTYFCQVSTGVTVHLNQDLGVGLDEVSPYTLASLKTAIEGVADFSVTISGNSAVPAAFLGIVRDGNLLEAPVTLKALAYSEVLQSSPSLLSDFYAYRFNDDFEIASSVVIQNVLYIAGPKMNVLKYDGQRLYLAGVPAGAKPTVAGSVAGAITGQHYFKIQYSQIDAAGNVIEGNLSEAATLGSSVTSKQYGLTIPNPAFGQALNTACAQISGNQSSVNTINVTANTLQVGDTAYFYENGASAHIERKITARTNTTITIAGAPVSVTNGAHISNNLRIVIWRSKTSATEPQTYYLVDEVPYFDSATLSVFDNKTDTQLGAILEAPATNRSPPPQARYISQWNGVAVVAGLKNPNAVNFSDIDGPEYFDPLRGEYIIETTSGDRVKGIAQNNEVFTVHKSRAFAVVSGDQGNGTYRVEIKAQDIGCVSHHSIQEIDGVLVWLSEKGPRCSTGGQVPRPLGEHSDSSGRPTGASRIDPIFEQLGLRPEQKLKLKHSVAVNDTTGKRYIIHVPAENPTGPSYPNQYSRVLAYDYGRDAWLEWSNMNFAGGAIVENSEFYFQERRYDAELGDFRAYVYKRHSLDDSWDYADHNLPVGGDALDAWEYSTAWEALGQPSILKTTLKIRAFSLEEIANNSFDVEVIQETNYQAGAQKAQFRLALQSGGYGTNDYGTEPYGDPVEGAKYHSLYRDRVRSWRFRFRNNNIHENVILSGWEVECVAPFRPVFKK